MPRLKVLFADDQIPDENIPDNEINRVMSKRFPNADPRFINAFLPMRETVKTLGDGYDVTIANTTKIAMDLVNANHYDIAIVDLGWWADKEVPNGRKDNSAGIFVMR
jgi:hypothetical protein